MEIKQGGFNAIKKHTVWNFLFPLYPLSVFKNTKLMAYLAILISLRLIFSIVSIPIPGFVQNISFSWVPLMVAGWYFGPVVGFFFGWVTDTLCYLIFTSGIWFWMYAIQESCVCVISGIFGFVYRTRSQSKHLKIWIDLLAQQIIYFLFGAICLGALLSWADPGNVAGKFDGKYDFYKVLALCLMALFIIIMEFVTVYQYHTYKENKSHLLLFIYGTTLVVLLMEIFSFAIGPIATVEYLRALNGKLPAKFEQYGLIVYLIPKVIIQSVKDPFESFLFVGIIWALTPSFDNMLNGLNSRWDVNKWFSN